MLNCEIPTEKKGDWRILFYFFDHQYNIILHFFAKYVKIC